MRKVWIVVANGSQSMIYKAESAQKLIQLKSFNHQESHLSRRELNSDRPGRQTQRMGYGTDTMEEKTPPKVKEANQFAQEIADYLEEGFNSGEFERIYLIVKPPFLGHIRQNLHPNVSKLVESEVHKDLTQMRPEQIREYLPPVL
ncbi:MAG: host attachment protein [Chlamydiales bacterium]|nr:host attachment protein [Chlamydiales bacterium]